MSTFASLFAFERDFGVRSFMLREDMHTLKNFLDEEKISQNLKVLEDYLPKWSQFEWEDIFREEDILNLEVWRSHLSGSLIDVGEFPNAVVFYKKYLDEIKKILAPKQKFLDAATQRLQNLFARRVNVTASPGDANRSDSNSDVKFISVHVRRSDYSHHLAILYNLTYVDKNYFWRAFKYFRDKFQNVIFYVVSDDPEWCKATFGAADGNDKFVDNRNDIFFVGSRKHSHATIFDEIGTDLALLSLANHSILTYGTFGMWGALLAGGEAVMPASHSDTKEQKEIAAADLDGWITL